jgi:hypothetical protein
LVTAAEAAMTAAAAAAAQGGAAGGAPGAAGAGHIATIQGLRADGRFDIVESTGEPDIQASATPCES